MKFKMADADIYWAGQPKAAIQQWDHLFFAIAKNTVI